LNLKIGNKVRNKNNNIEGYCAIEKLRYCGQDWKDNFKWLVNQLSEDQVRYIFDFKND